MIIVAGMAGTGKSTQAKLLATKSGYTWLSTGAILRAHITGKRQRQIQKGKLLNDREIINVLEKAFDQVDKHDELILDGFPRTVPQMEWLLRKSSVRQCPRVVVLNLIVSQHDILNRLLKRGRKDDNKAAIEKRFEEYQLSTKPILDEFKKRGITVYDIDASLDVNTIHQKIINVLADTLTTTNATK